jgi:hypothetical protein
MSVAPYHLSTVCIQGHSHRKAPIPVPCQDACKGLTLSNGCPVAIVSDGAGSSTFSHLASTFCVDKLAQVCDSYIPRLSPLCEIDASSEVNRSHIRLLWHNVAMDMFRETRSALLNFGVQNGHSASDLHCTLILLIRTPFGFFSANIGDGRAGYHNGSCAAPLMVPFMTYMAGATYFLAKERWEMIFRSSVVYDESVDYFFATSDGCQSFVMDKSRKGPRKGIYNDVLGDEAFYDYNHPYEPFFTGLIESLRETDSKEEADARLKRLIESGIYVIRGEERELKTLSDPGLDDDKSLILYYQ